MVWCAAGAVGSARCGKLGRFAAQLDCVTPLQLTLLLLLLLLLPLPLRLLFAFDLDLPGPLRSGE
ncbi:hypothetical protein [Xanthomonas graminis]|uniref:hypothetical protein n=1 Tax=Xanthomonas graminis TaxID=3390026 RepID=UPI000A7643C8|nr:hypothetical protein [Xanthomonas translucens]